MVALLHGKTLVLALNALTLTHMLMLTIKIKGLVSIELNCAAASVGKWNTLIN